MLISTETEGGFEMGEVGGARMANLGGSPAERRQEILETTLQAVKRCQVSITVRKNLVFMGTTFLR